MDILLQCDACDKKMKVPEKYAGKLIRCPACKEGVRVPTPSQGMDPVVVPTTSGEKAAPIPTREPSGPTVRNPPSPDAGSRPGPSRPTSPPRPRPPTTTAKPAVPSRSSTPSSSRDTATAHVCPHCSTALPTGTISCKKCGYHFKLKRRLAIGTALQSITEHAITSTGASQSRVVKIEAHRSSGRKHARNMVLGLVIVFVLLGAAILINVRLFMKPPPLSALVEQPNVPPLGQNLRSFHPFYTGRSISITIPLNHLFVKDVPATSTSEIPEKAWAQAAHALELPVHLGNHIVSGRHAQSVVREASMIRGNFSLEAISTNGIRIPKVLVFRGSGEQDKPNYLQGALLDLGQDYLATMQELLEAQAQYRVEHERVLLRTTDRLEDRPRLMAELRPNLRITGTLTFLPVSRAALDEESGDWGWALHRRITSLVPHLTRLPAPEGNEKDMWYFCPVIVVRNFSLTSMSDPGHFSE